MLTGYKTYIAAGLAMAAAGYHVLVDGDTVKAYDYFVIGLGLAGLRNALSNK